jgi:hypothetical protein
MRTIVWSTIESSREHKNTPDPVRFSTPDHASESRARSLARHCATWHNWTRAPWSGPTVHPGSGVCTTLGKLPDPWPMFWTPGSRACPKSGSLPIAPESKGQVPDPHIMVWPLAVSAVQSTQRCLLLFQFLFFANVLTLPIVHHHVKVC